MWKCLIEDAAKRGFKHDVETEFQRNVSGLKSALENKLTDDRKTK